MPQKIQKKEGMFHEDMTLAEVLKHPGTEEILNKHGLPCMHCPMAAYEMGMLKLGDVVKQYGLDLTKVLKDLDDLEKDKPVKKKK